MERLKWKVLGLSTMRWNAPGTFYEDELCVCYSGNNSQTHGMGFIVGKSLSSGIKGFMPISDRVALMKLKLKHKTLCILQVYAHTADSEEAEILKFYEQVETALKNRKSKEMLIVMGDFNANVGNKKNAPASGGNGLGNMNERGVRLIEWGASEFAKPEKKPWTWASANGRCLNQIDYILAPKRFMFCVLDSSTAVRADCGSDHNPVVVKLRVQLKLPCKETKKKLPDWDNINPKTVKEIHGTLEERLGKVDKSKMSIEETYGIFVQAINVASECVPKSKKQNQKS